MINKISKIQISALLILISTFIYAQDDTPSEFDDAIGDNPTDTPIDSTIWILILLVSMLLLVLYMKRQKKA